MRARLVLTVTLVVGPAESGPSNTSLTVTVGQVSDGSGTAYRDYRNRSVLLRDAFEIVLRSIKGENVEKLIQARRSVAAGK
jgi:hypothetical protein